MAMDVQNCQKVLKHLSSNLDKATSLPEYKDVFRLISEIANKKKKREKKTRHDAFRSIMYASGTCRKRLNSCARYQNKLDGKNLPLLPLPSTPEVELEPPKPTLSEHPIQCHICHQSYFEVHHHYYSLCPSCAKFNFAQRSVTADLSSKTSLVTGGRVKIGFEIAKKLLRCGSKVFITTRFPEDALRRYQVEEDYHVWSHNLTIVYLDLINFQQVVQFVNWLQSKVSKLDILILNAAQTISRERVFYENVLQDYERSDHVIEFGARSKIYEGKALLGWNSVNSLEQSSDTKFLMPGMETDDDDKVENDKQISPAYPNRIQLEWDEDHQIKEYRENNTWSERLDDFSQKDFLSVLVINLFSPACLVQMLTPLLRKDKLEKTPKVFQDSGLRPNENPKEDFSFVVLVSAVEGLFKVKTCKSPNHPHTNAAKAGLNMFTRTSASDYRNRYNILLNSVDTGFITVETRNVNDFVPPLDNVDGMARVLQPVFECVNEGNLLFGKMLKNFEAVDF